MVTQSYNEVCVASTGDGRAGVPSSSLPGDGRAGGALRLDESCEEQFAGTSRLKCIDTLPEFLNVLAKGRKLRLMKFILGEKIVLGCRPSSGPRRFRMTHL